MTATIDLTTSSVTKPAPGVVDAVAGRRVLLFGINYAPERTGIAPYTTGVAEELAHTAASVTVIAGLPSYPAWKVEDGYLGRHRVERLNGVELHRLWHVVPGRQTAMLRGAYESSFLAHATAVGRGKRADLVVAVTPALGGAVAAAIVAKRLGAPLLIIVQDLMGKAAAQSGISGGGKVAAATGALEGWALRRAERIAVVSDAFRAPVRAYGVPNNRIDLLPNWSHISVGSVDRPAVRARLGWGPDLRVALHTGNMGLKQDLGNIIEAARLAQADTSLRFVLMGDGSQRCALEAQAAGLANVEFLPPCGEEEYGQILAAADVLLLNERPSVGDMSLPSKLTSYFLAGRPVLGAVAAEGATGAELAASGGAVIVDAGQPQPLVDAIVRLCAQPEQAAVLGRRGRAYAEAKLTPAAAFSRLNAILGRLLGIDVSPEVTVDLTDTAADFDAADTTPVPAAEIDLTATAPIGSRVAARIAD